MLKILQLIFATIGIIIALYGLITKDFTFQSYMMLSLGLMFLVMSIQAFKAYEKTTGRLFLVTSLLALFVSVQRFILT